MSDPTKCDMDVYNNGQVVGIYSIPKEEAEEYCKKQTEKTGYKHDWHYSGGRVVVKALIPAEPTPQPTPEVFSDSVDHVCNQEIYESGYLVGTFVIAPEIAQGYCDLQTQITGNPHDWYSTGNQVTIKSLKPNAPVHEDVARCLTSLVSVVRNATEVLEKAEDAARKGWKEEVLGHISTVRLHLRSVLMTKTA